MSGIACISCAADNARPVLALRDCLCNAVRLYQDREAAREAPRGAINLMHCENCDFIWNADFDSALVQYDHLYESTQSHSPRFRVHEAELAHQILTLSQGHATLHSPNSGDTAPPVPSGIVEIGCGQGEFLAQIAALKRTRQCSDTWGAGTSDSTGALSGFDPAYDAQRVQTNAPSGAGTHPDRAGYSITAQRFQPDDLPAGTGLVLHKMTLEHVPDPIGFLRDIHRAMLRVGAHTHVAIIPNFDHILGRSHFWDVIYEHCNYLTRRAFVAMLGAAGFDDITVTIAYEGQHLIATSRPRLGTKDGARNGTMDGTGNGTKPADDRSISPHMADLGALMSARAGWQKIINGPTEPASGPQVFALWGAGSKAVSFLDVTETADRFVCAVDINPRKQGSYLPGSGLPIVSPAAIAALNVTDIIIVNPIYLSEIQTKLDDLGLSVADGSITLHCLGTPHCGGRPE